MAENREQLGRRTFLNRMALAAGAAQLSPELLTPARAAEAAAPPAAKSTTGGQTKRLAEYAATLRYDDIPAAVRQRIVNCITDTAAVILYGGKLPWSQIVIAYAKRSGSGGKSAILGTGEATLHPPSAALAHGAMAHAFEMDNLTDPDFGLASRRLHVLGGPGRRTGPRPHRARAHHRHDGRRRSHDPHWTRSQGHARAARLPCPWHDGIVRRRGDGGKADGVRRRQNDQRHRHRGIAFERLARIRALQRRRYGEEAASGTCRRIGRVGGKPRQ